MIGRIRVLQFVPCFGLGGTERHVVSLARTLDSRHFEIFVGGFDRWGELLEELTEREIPVGIYQISKLYDAHAWRQRLRFAQDLRRQRIHLVHTYNFYANVFAVPAARLAGVPVVASIRGANDDLTPMQRRAQRLVCRLAHRIAVNAEALRLRLIAEGYDPRKIVVIRNGVDVSRFSGRRSDGRLHRELGLPPRAPLVAVLSRLIRLKGVEYFLEAAALVAARIPQAHFVVMGDQYQRAQDGTIVPDVAYRNELERYAARLGLDGRAVFTGNRADVPELLPEVTVSVLPSLSEGLSNAVLEAMASGVPVVATAVGGTAEAVEDGVTGLLVPPRDAPALARAICRLLEDPELAARFRTAGSERVVQHFSLERLARETEGLYLDLLAGRARRQAILTAGWDQ